MAFKLQATGEPARSTVLRRDAVMKREIGGPLLSKLHRRAEALDGVCLRAWGHPHDYAIRQELLSALEWDRSLDPQHAHPVIRDLFRQVHDRSIDLASRIRASADSPDGVVHAISDGAHTLRLSLAALIQVLKTRQSESRN